MVITRIYEYTPPPPINALATALEASKDIASIKLIKYDGDPLGYVVFIERFKLLIYDESHLSDDIRMANSLEDVKAELDPDLGDVCV